MQAKAGELLLEPQRQLPESDARDRDFLLPLLAEVVEEDGSVLVFCASRKQCQSCAELIADLLPGHIPPVSEVHIPTMPCGHQKSCIKGPRELPALGPRHSSYSCSCRMMCTL